MGYSIDTILCSSSRSPAHTCMHQRSKIYNSPLILHAASTSAPHCQDWKNGVTSCNAAKKWFLTNRIAKQ